MPEFSQKWWQLVADREQALRRTKSYDAGTAGGRVNAAMDVIGVINYFGELHETYGEVGRGLERKGIVDDLRSQLAPDQQVFVLFDRETNTVKSIDRPGHGYLLGADSKLEYFPLVGDDGGICRGNVVRETTEFNVRDHEGRKKVILDGRDPIENALAEEDKAERRRERPDPKESKLQ